MCYGAYCSDYGSSPIGTGLSYDAPSDNTKTQRYNAACSSISANVCQTGESCDEYPFKTTSDTDIDDQYARCVPENENQSRSYAFCFLIQRLNKNS